MKENLTQEEKKLLLGGACFSLANNATLEYSAYNINEYWGCECKFNNHPNVDSNLNSGGSCKCTCIY